MARHVRPWRRAAAIAVLIACPLAAPARAQGTPESEARFQFGSLFVTPGIAIEDVGMDSNVYNSPDGAAQDDFTLTIGPSLQAIYRVPLARLTGTADLDFVYFATAKDQESVNQRYQALVEVLFTRLRPWVRGELLRTRERPGFEIDARARRTELAAASGADVYLSGRTAIAIGYARTRHEFEDGERFLGQELRGALNRTHESYGGGVRFALTSLTTLRVDVSRERDRFDFSPGRDATLLRVAPALEFSPDALVRGRASIGYGAFDPEDPALPGYAGLVANAAVSMTIGGDTRVDVRVDRDVAYSYEPRTPYYVATGGGVTVAQHLVGPIEIVGGASRQHLAYRSRAGAVTGQPALPPIDRRADVVTSYLAGVGSRIGGAARVGFDVEYTRRTTGAPLLHPYDRLRAFASLTYGVR